MGPEFLLIIALLFGLLWFSGSRSRKQQRERMVFQSELAPGQEVVTASGLVGTVTAVEGDLVTLESGTGGTTTWVRGAIARAYEPPVEDEDDEDEIDTDSDEADAEERAVDTTKDGGQGDIPGIIQN